MLPYLIGTDVKSLLLLLQGMATCLTGPEKVTIIEEIRYEHMKILAVKQFGFKTPEIDSIEASHRGEADTIKLQILERYLNKLSGSDEENRRVLWDKLCEASNDRMIHLQGFAFLAPKTTGLYKCYRYLSPLTSRGCSEFLTVRWKGSDWIVEGVYNCLRKRTGLLIRALVWLSAKPIKFSTGFSIIAMIFNIHHIGLDTSVSIT